MKILYTVRKNCKKNFNNQESISSESLHMYIQLTNAHPDYKNQSVIINTDHIVAIYSETILKGSNGEFTVTCIHCPPHGTWNVLEDLKTVRATLDRVTLSEQQRSIDSDGLTQEFTSNA